MTTFTEFERDENAETGVMWRDFITAIGVFVYTNRTPSVAEAARAFNTTPALVREAVDEHPWLFRAGHDDPAQDYIGSDGE